MNKFVATAAAALTLAMSAGSAQAVTILYSDGSAIPVSTGFSSSFLTIDVNNDGRADLSFREVDGNGYTYTGAYGRNGTRISYGDAFDEGELIDGAIRTTRAVALTGSYDFTSGGRRYEGTYGAWDDNTTGTRTGFLGFRLGTGEYGWAQLSLDPLGSSGGSGGQLLSFGYETDPGVGIAAGAEVPIIPNPLPASAWMIGAGVLGLGWFGRRKKRNA